MTEAIAFVIMCLIFVALIFTVGTISRYDDKRKMAKGEFVREINNYNPPPNEPNPAHGYKELGK